MNNLQDALKNAGFAIEIPKKKTDIKLPFTDNTFGYTNKMFEDNILFIKNKMFLITKDELNDMQCRPETESIKKLLQRNFDKLYAIEELPASDYGYEDKIPGLYIYFVYSYISKKFEIVIHDLFEYNIEKVLNDNDIPMIKLDKDMKNRINPLAFHIAKHCDTILLYIKDKKDSLLYYPNIPFKFSKIQEDKKAMAALRTFLDKSDFYPNPDKYYFIKESYTFESDIHQAITGQPLYYLKKATKEDIEKIKEN